MAMAAVSVVALAGPVSADDLPPGTIEYETTAPDAPETGTLAPGTVTYRDPGAAQYGQPDTVKQEPVAAGAVQDRGDECGSILGLLSYLALLPSSLDPTGLACTTDDNDNTVVYDPTQPRDVSNNPDRDVRFVGFPKRWPKSLNLQVPLLEPILG